MEWLDNFWSIYSNLVLTIGINALLALSIWLTLSCGLLAMANAAFMGIGAYTASILTMNYGAPFPVALAAGIATPTVVALLIGGLFLGFAEVMSVAYIGSTMRDAVAFGLLFIVLLLRPQGMFGKVLERKA